MKADELAIPADKGNWGKSHLLSARNEDDRLTEMEPSGLPTDGARSIAADLLVDRMNKLIDRRLAEWLVRFHDLIVP